MPKAEVIPLAEVIPPGGSDPPGRNDSRTTVPNIDDAAATKQVVTRRDFPSM